MARLLLISNSTVHERGYLDHVEDEIQDFLESPARVAFVPFALYDRNRYAVQVAARFAKMGYELTSVHDVSNQQRVIGEPKAVFVGGGNTFRLFEGLYVRSLRASIAPKAL